VQLRVTADELEQLGLCRASPRSDCIAAFTVKGPGQIWPVATWDDAPQAERINLRGWFPLLDTMADELLLWWPKGGCFFVSKDRVTYRPTERDARGAMFLMLESHQLSVVPPRQLGLVRPYSAG
jgi:hypothetical protein